MPIKGVLNARVPVKLWTDLYGVESEALDQLKNVASLPFIFKHVAAMPDCHVGKGATVGSVIATQGAIIPSAVGVDIGCGMAAIKLKGININELLPRLAELRHSIERSIPTGFNGNNKVGKEIEEWKGWDDFDALTTEVKKERGDASHKLCSLGGGNHFIEVCKDLNDNAWVMIHSGSRNIGLKIANYYINKSKELMKTMFIQVPDRELSYLPQNTIEFSQYMHDLKWAQAYAAENRRLMLNRILKDVYYLLDKPIEKEVEVNCHHNFAQMEHHFGQDVLITRKGAIQVRSGQLGIIPGSMGTKSFIVSGLGNPESFESASHGAGRKMSRSAAKKAFTKEDIETQLAGIECRKDNGIIDELPGAYKDIDTVMANQTDLVEIKEELKQVMCIKG